LTRTDTEELDRRRAAAGAALAALAAALDEQLDDAAETIDAVCAHWSGVSADVYAAIVAEWRESAETARAGVDRVRTLLT
jgi:uncharacterized protein YukE